MDTICKSWYITLLWAGLSDYSENLAFLGGEAPTP